MTRWTLARAWREAIQRRFASTVAEQRKEKQLLEQAGRERSTSTRRDVSVFADIPQGDIDITRLSDDQQRQVYEAFQLELRYNTIRNEATIRVTVTSGTAAMLAAGDGGDRPHSETKKGGDRNSGFGSRPTGLECFWCAARDSNPEPAD
ncbi:hypothetical protein Ais01nite_70260 [Asanoa ishikariensis]|nr:hypothetical protein Ais01nite_70260 [Asanoa ishikariensis]